VVYSEFPHVDSGNVYLVTGAHPTLIDCGCERAVPTLVRNLSRLGLAISDIEQVIASHGDFDHTQGYHLLRQEHPGLQLSIHYHDHALVQGTDPYRTCSYLYGRPFVPFSAEHCRPLGNGDVVPAGNGELTVIHAPGHTEGSICLLGRIDGRNVLFAGDVVGGAMKSLDGADLHVWAGALAAWAQSLDRLAGMDFEWVLNGHEPAASLPLTRDDFDRKRRMFGKMLNPWFALGEDEPEMIPEPAAAG
jgi:glyoxylase-like metal-dependent hydrolase (beta-lactamase superfamily II)